MNENNQLEMDSFLKEAESFYIKIFNILEEKEISHLLKIFKSKSSELVKEPGTNNFVNLMNNYMEKLFKKIHENNNISNIKVTTNQKLKKRQGKLLDRIRRLKKKKRKKKKSDMKSSKIIEEVDSKTDNKLMVKSSSTLKKPCVICNEEINSEEHYILVNAKIIDKNFSNMVMEKLKDNTARTQCKLLILCFN